MPAAVYCDHFPVGAKELYLVAEGLNAAAVAVKNDERIAMTVNLLVEAYAVDFRDMCGGGVASVGSSQIRGLGRLRKDKGGQQEDGAHHASSVAVFLARSNAATAAAACGWRVGQAISMPPDAGPVRRLTPAVGALAAFALVFVEVAFVLRSPELRQLIDGVALDMPGFERLPESQMHQVVLHRLYQSVNEFHKYGKKPLLVPWGAFGAPVAATLYWQEADRYPVGHPPLTTLTVPRDLGRKIAASGHRLGVA